MKEKNWSAGTRNQSRKHPVERGVCAYLLALIDETWLRPLKNEITFYTKVTPIEMLAHLTTASGGSSASTSSTSTFSSPTSGNKIRASPIT